MSKLCAGNASRNRTDNVVRFDDIQLTVRIIKDDYLTTLHRIINSKFRQAFQLNRIMQKYIKRHSLNRTYNDLAWSSKSLRPQLPVPREHSRPQIGEHQIRGRTQAHIISRQAVIHCTPRPMHLGRPVRAVLLGTMGSTNVHCSSVSACRLVILGLLTLGGLIGSFACFRTEPSR